MVGRQLRNDSSQGQLNIGQMDSNPNLKKVRIPGDQIDMKFSSI